MKNIFYDLKEVIKTNNDGSFETKDSRKSILNMALGQLIYELNYPELRLKYLKPKHIDSVVNHWLSQNIAVSTIKSRMSHLRWLCRKIGKQNIIARKNADYGIPNRDRTANETKGWNIANKDINKVDDEYVRASIQLIRAFGLRREESIKFVADYADKGNYIQLKGSWCKNGRPRTIEIRNDQQRQALDQAKSLTGKESLIPMHLSYKQQRTRFNNQTRKAGLRKLHGLRHRYAENRYKALTGWNAPTQGGPKRKALTPQQKQIDKKARLVITEEFGHERISIVADYIGA